MKLLNFKIADRLCDGDKTKYRSLVAIGLTMGRFLNFQTTIGTSIYLSFKGYFFNSTGTYKSIRVITWGMIFDLQLFYYTDDILKKKFYNYLNIREIE